MKNIFAIAFFLLMSATSIAQIEFIEIAQSEVVGKIDYVYIEKMGKTDYNFYYKNMNEVAHEYVKFSFKNVDNDLDKLYQGLAQGFETVPRDPLKMKANGEIIWLKYTRNTVDNIVTLTFEQNLSVDPILTSKSKDLTIEDINNLFKK